MNSEKFSQALENISDELLADALNAYGRKNSRRNLWIRVAAMAATVAILLTVLLWPRETESGELITAPGILKVYACDITDGNSPEEMEPYEITNGLNVSVGGKWYPLWQQNAGQRSKIPYTLWIDEAYYPGKKISLDISVNCGKFFADRGTVEIGSETTVNNRTTIYWDGETTGDVEAGIAADGGIYADIIIRADGHVVGFGLIEMRYDKNTASCYPEKCDTVCFPMRNEKLQNISEEYVHQQLDKYKQDLEDFKQDLEDIMQDIEGMKNPLVPTEPPQETIYVDPSLTKLTEEEFAPIRTELETWCTPYNMALTHIYDSPENVNLYWFLHTSEVSTPVTQSDRVYLASKGWMHVNELPIQRYTAEAIDNALMECFGVTLAQTNRCGLDSFTYWVQTDSYYVRYAGPNYAVIDIQEAVWNRDGTISVFYFNDCCIIDDGEKYYSGPMKAKLKPVEGGYRFLSNEPVSSGDTIYVDPRLTRLTEEEFDPIQIEMLTWYTPYNMALTHIYDIPENVNFYWFLHSTKGSIPATQNDKDFLASKGWTYLDELDIQRFTAETIDDALLECFGMTLEQTNKNGLASFTYWDQTDSYYIRYAGSHNAEVDIQEAVWNWDGTISVYYFNDCCIIDDGEKSYSGPMEAKLKPVEGGYQFLSNLPVE